MRGVWRVRGAGTPLGGLLGAAGDSSALLTPNALTPLLSQLSSWGLPPPPPGAGGGTAGLLPSLGGAGPSSAAAQAQAQAQALSMAAVLGVAQAAAVAAAAKDSGAASSATGEPSVFLSLAKPPLTPPGDQGCTESLV